MTEREIAYTALQPGTPVTGSDGVEIGKVASVLAEEEADIFHGLTLKTGFLERDLFIPADSVEQITTASVTVDFPGAEAGSRLEPYEG